MTDKGKRPGTESSGSTGVEPPVLLESTLPPTPLKQLLAAEGASIAVLSADSTLIETIEQAGGEQYPIVVASAWQDLLVHIERQSCGIVVLDADSVTDTLARRLAELRGVRPNIVVLVASPRKEAEALIGLLSDRKIHRLLMKPPALGITRLLLESAVSRWLEQREAGVAGDPTRQVAALELRAPGRRWWPWAAAFVVVSMSGAGLVYWRSLPPPALPPRVVGPAQPDRAPASVQVPVQASASGAAQPPTGEVVGRSDPLIEGLLERARSAAAEGRLDAPPGDNALDHYLALLRIEPEHAEANAQVDQLLEALFAQAEDALLAGDVEAAAALLTRVRRLRPDSTRLRFLDAQLAQVMTRRGEAAAQAARAAAPQPTTLPSELESLLTLADTRLKRGQLLSPPADNAKVYLDRAAALAPAEPRVGALRGELAGALLASARMLSGAGQQGQAAALLAEAAALGADPQAVAELGTTLAGLEQQARQQRMIELVNAGIERLDRGQLIEPAQDSALAYLSRARDENPVDAYLAEPWLRLVTSLTEQAQAAIAARRWDEAERWLGALQAAEPAAPGVVALVREARVARMQEAYLATPVPAAELELLAASAPVYPESALRNGLQGWVAVEFVVDRQGLPRDAEIRAAEPPGRFDQAALAAVQSYRFVPFEEDGAIYERLASVRIRFALE